MAVPMREQLLRPTTAAERQRREAEAAPRPPARGGRRPTLLRQQVRAARAEAEAERDSRPGTRLGTPGIRRRAETPAGVAGWARALARAQPLCFEGGGQRPVSAPRSPVSAASSLATECDTPLWRPAQLSGRPATGERSARPPPSSRAAVKCRHPPPQNSRAAQETEAAPLWHTYTSSQAMAARGGSEGPRRGNVSHCCSAWGPDSQQAVRQSDRVPARS
eukprot:TRINITY_DN2961_c0_g1_i1.p2 TRINITY_DN2961_c0_g1~~TRINITY_DN2961_c0_g1_i1.p2  ORF type:complete len:220 (+),score=53.79 TRINITY_DN2961_c0_g1_i1:296-955(+)